MARNAFTDEFSLVNWEDPRLFHRAVLVLSPRVKKHVGLSKYVSWVRNFFPQGGYRLLSGFLAPRDALT